ncbi:MAG: GumC family protein [Pelosinus sp.]|nr:GumC family protein [Pelosinus sp.]
MHSDQFGLRDIVDILKRRRKVIYYSVLVMMAIALLINTLSATLYESTVSIRVKYFRGPNETVVTMAPDELLRQQILTYFEIIKSRSVVETVIDKVYGENPDKPSYKDIANKINTRLLPGTQIMEISVRAPSAEEAQLMTNTLLEEFINRLTEIVRAEGKEARVFIGDRKEEVKQKLEITEKNLVDYKKGNQTISIEDQTKSVVGMQADLKKLIVDNHLNLRQAQAKLSSVNRQLNSQNVGVFADNPQIQIYKTRLSDQEVELVGLQQSFKDTHPRIVALQAAIAETKAKLNEEINRVAKEESPSSNTVYQSLLQNKLQSEADVAVAQAKDSALSQAISAQEQEAKSMPEREQGLAKLMRDYTIAEDTYKILAKRYEEASIDEVTQPTNVQVIDRADLPIAPSRPRSMLNVVIAVIIGLCGGIILAFVLDYFYKTIDTPEDVRKYLGIRVIGSIPDQKPAKPSSWRRFFKVPNKHNTGGISCE